MQLTENEIRFLIWASLTMLAVLGFIGALGVKALINMGKDLTDIKISVKEVATQHAATETRVTRLETIVYEKH